jgi:DNA-binding transcriptional MerR regulator
MSEQSTNRQSAGGKTENEYTIGAVARMTGLSTQVIRAWERRYGAVIAARTDKGRRVYCPEHVEKLSLLKALTDRGSPISAVANLDTETLRQRVEEMDQITARPLSGRVRVAVLGAFLPSLLRGDLLDAFPIELVASGADPRRFGADARNLAPDVLVIEAINLNERLVRQVVKLAADSRAGRVVVAYGFGRSKDEKELLDRGMRLLKTPVSDDELAVAILAAAANLSVQSAGTVPPAPVEAREIDGESPSPRRYDEQQLVRLARIETGVDCECPRHVAELLKMLTAFEIYSAECEDRSEEDAALHAFLHVQTAHARAIMESALDRLVEVEKLAI